jgi:hypothetical protein
MKLLGCVCFPDGLSICYGNACERSIDTINIDPVIIDDGTTSRAIVVAVGIRIDDRLFPCPKDFARFGMVAGQSLRVTESIKLKPASLAGDSISITFASFRSPNDFETFTAPLLSNSFFARRGVVLSSQHSRPIVTHSSRPQARYHCRTRRIDGARLSKKI